MPAWIAVYCQKSVAHISPDQLLAEISKADLATLAEDYNVAEEQVKPARANLHIQAALQTKFDIYKLHYRTPEQRPVAIRRSAAPATVSEEVREALERLEGKQGTAADKLRGHLGQVTEVISVELGWSQLKDMGIVLAYEVARSVAQVGEGYIRDDDGAWSYVDATGAFVPIMCEDERYDFPAMVPGFLNRRGLYIEDGTACIVRVTHIAPGETGVQAHLTSIPTQGLTATLKGTEIEYHENESPFGAEWDIFKEWGSFYFDEHCWDASRHMGWRLLFDEDLIERFLRKDESWLDYWSGESAEEKKDAHEPSSDAGASPAIEIDWVEIPGGEFLVGLSDEQRAYLRERVRIEQGFDRLSPRTQAAIESAVKKIRQGQAHTPQVYAALKTEAGLKIATVEFFLQQIHPAQTIWLDTFYIAHFPITGKQYREFLHKKSLPHEQGSPYCPDDEPIFVRHADAEAFCRYAGARLPTEDEWEKAARGTDGRLYPWGNTWDPSKGNFEKQRTPVSQYPEGASPFGVWDMAGNSYEWTSTPSGEKSYILKSCYTRWEKWYIFGWATIDSPVELPWLFNLVVNRQTGHSIPHDPGIGTGFRPVRDTWPRKI